MDNNRLTIPKKIKAGFQERSDTYSKRLGFVIKNDGNKADPKSWTNWIDKKMPVEEYDNEPIGGFVLNRDVGGTHRSYGWDARREKVRVYDPRNFEIEITVDNLLFILQECSSIKGKGLEGDFVYAWMGSQIVLIPIDSQEYKNSCDFTILQKMNVHKKNLVVGYTYVTKQNNQVIYMGKHDWYEYHYRDKGNYHIFYRIDSKSFICEKHYKILAKVIDDKVNDSYADLFVTMMNDYHSSSPDRLEFLEKETDDYSCSLMYKDKYYSAYQIGKHNNFYGDAVNLQHELFLDDQKVVQYKNISYKNGFANNVNKQDVKIGEIYIVYKNGARRKL